jgi:hypothetical protein
MKSSIAKILVGGLLAGLLVPWSASAAPGGAVCRISGSVSLVDPADQSAPFTPLPLSDVRRPGAYDFKDTNIACLGTLGTTPINAVYSVQARGTTTGLTDPAGDNCNDAKNAAPNGVFDNSFIATRTAAAVGATPSGPANLNGVVNFSRVGSLVLVEGNIADPAAGATYQYAVQLNFSPGGRDASDLPSFDPNQFRGCLPDAVGGTGGITTAALDGFVQIRSLA